jgi:hypothetical protein
VQEVGEELQNVYALVRFRPAAPIFKPLQTNGQHTSPGDSAGGAASDGFPPLRRLPG